MRLLLDTHVWLWTIADPDRIRSSVRDALEDYASELLLSAASTWEIAIKYRLGKLPLPEPPAEFVPKRLVRDGVGGLPVEHRHAARVASLPEHHRDPFDRMLVAQAQSEALTLVSADGVFRSYDVDLLEA